MIQQMLAEDFAQNYPNPDKDTKKTLENFALKVFINEEEAIAQAILNQLRQTSKSATEYFKNQYPNIQDKVQQYQQELAKVAA